MTLHELSRPSLRSHVELRRAREAGLRRSIDIAGAGAAMLLLAPLILIVTLAIWIEDGRPILFSQLRLGHRGRPFQMYKFRKFRPDCDDRGCPLTMQADNRLTRIGRLLAASKVDELPQLWNVLRGDMSLVGPRPESLAFADCFRNGFERIHEHKPGLFGPCQVLFRNESKLYPANAEAAEFYRQVIFPAKANIDLAYFSRRTFVSDLGWIFRAAWMIVTGSRDEAAICGQSIPSRK
jgi:lipopolysaccharide/colanic/teichoic acid biosynthesis glycosyltransferase